MNYAISVIRADPWVFFGVLVALSWLAGALTKGAGFFKSLLAQVLVAAVAVGITAAVARYTGKRVEGDASRQGSNASLAGSFSASGAKLGTWTVSPSRCLDGHERGFEGVLFVFDEGPVKELRIDTARKKHNTISVHLNDEGGSVVQLRERECQLVSAERRAGSPQSNGRPVRRSRGSVRIVCPQLKGQATFDGC
jgi:hypothetical protein